MTPTSVASNALAPCYPLTCSSEEYASSLLAAQKRRDSTATAPKNPGQGMTASTPELRPYQAGAIVSLRSVLAGVRRALLYSPTGSGKTEIAIALILLASMRGSRVVFLCNRIHLVEQASRRFRRAGIQHGIIQGENTARTYEKVIIASIQTVARRGMPDGVDLLIIDEAHACAGSSDYRKIMEAVKCPVIGLTATPFSRGLGKHYDELGGPLFERMVIAATIPELIADGYLVDVDVYAPSEPDMTGIKQSRNAFGDMDYTDADVGRATDKPELIGDIVTHWLKLAKDTPTVCFASNIAHSKHIVECFVAAGVAARHIDAYTDADERQAVFRQFESGEITIISNVGILCEGWDSPACRTMILARPTRSLIRYIQMAGRVLRPHASKVRALILDHSGTVARLGFPTDDFPLELDDGTPKQATDGGEREAALPKPCPSCSFMKTVHACPVCGFAPEKKSGVTVHAGDLVLLEKRSKLPKMDKQEFYSQLVAVALGHGYKPGWISHKYREYFGVWPRGLRDFAMEPTKEVTDFLKHLQIRHAKSKGGKHASE
jgi:superfamily II DNA or RNA helicase